jgi:hypothetical protein
MIQEPQIETIGTHNRIYINHSTHLYGMCPTIMSKHLDRHNFSSKTISNLLKSGDKIQDFSISRAEKMQTTFYYN